MESSLKPNKLSERTTEVDRIDRLITLRNTNHVNRIVVRSVTEIEDPLSVEACAIHQGMKVVASDEECIGHVVRILAEPDGGSPTHNWIVKGLVLDNRRLIPVEWIESFADNLVRLAVGSRIIEQFSEYAPAEF